MSKNEWKVTIVFWIAVALILYGLYYFINHIFKWLQDFTSWLSASVGPGTSEDKYMYGAILLAVILALVYRNYCKEKENYRKE